jgi:hypothetical protein
MTKLHFAYVAAFLGATVGPPVLATVDAYIDYTVVYKEIQTDDYCYRSLPMWAEIGIPTASQMTALVTPTKILKLNSLGSSYIDINEVTKVPGIEAEYGNDTFDEATGVYTYTMKLNLKKHAWAGNSSVAARQTIVNQAKFALLAMNKNLAKVYPGKYKLWFTIDGLPSQSGLSGTVLPAATRFPYTAGSPLITALEKELINVEGSCR